MSKAVISYGEVLWDLLPAGPALGGAPCNLACRVGEMGDRATLVSRVGRDELGRQALAEMESAGLDTGFVQVDDRRPTGTVEVTLDEGGQPDYKIVPDVAYDFIETTEGLKELALKADCFCFGVLSQRSDVTRRTLIELLSDSALKATKFLDINLRKKCFSEETIAWSLEHADVLKLNEEEGPALAKMFALKARDNVVAIARELVDRWSLSHCVTTLGERGALCVSLDGSAVYEPGFKVEVVDACGSGDAFSAGFVRLLLRGRPANECCCLGNALGAIVATQHGATAPIEETMIERFLSGAVESIVDAEFAAIT